MPTRCATIRRSSDKTKGRVTRSVSLKDAFEMAAAVIVSLGGGGAIVFGLSGFLGKLWADRALQSQKAEGERQLERQRQEYAQLNISFTHQLDLASKQVQAELRNRRNRGQTGRFPAPVFPLMIVEVASSPRLKECSNSNYSALVIHQLRFGAKRVDQLDVKESEV